MDLPAFNDPALLEEALTHRSYLNEHPEAKRHNERLEFLGDAVLQLASASYVFRTFPDKPEGYLTQYRAAMVNAMALAEIAHELGLEEHVRLSKGEQRGSSRARTIILADAFEAVLGALYLDQGYAAADAFLAKYLYSKGDALVATYVEKDAKSRFQDLAQEHHAETPVYRTLEEKGPVHAPEFVIGAYMGEKEIARGEGKSKQEAEQAAAAAALSTMGW